MRAQKGHYGYLKKRKQGLLIRGGILLLGAASLYIVGLLTLKTTLNWLTLIAALSAIPMAMQFATLFSMLKYKGRPEEEYNEIRRITGKGILDTEIIVPQRDKFESLTFDYVYVHESGIYIWTNSLKMDLVKTPDYVRNFLRLNNCDGEVRLFTDLNAYRGILKKLPESDRDTAPDLLLQQEGVIRAISM